MSTRLRRRFWLGRAVQKSIAGLRRRIPGVLLRTPTDRLEDRRLLAQFEHSVIGVTALRSDPRFAGIDGTGSDIVVIDDSFDAGHIDFVSGGNRVAYKYDFADSDADVSAPSGVHGTHVASLAAGKYWGVAPGARLILLKAMTNTEVAGSGSFSPAAIASALQWVNNNRSTYNIVAVNMSLGGLLQTPTTQSDTARPYGTDLTTLGTRPELIVLGAASNSYDDSTNGIGFATAGIGFPSSHTKVASVTATFEQNYPTLNETGPAPENAQYPSSLRDQLTTFANRHPTMSDFAAPGYRVWGALPSTFTLPTGAGPVTVPGGLLQQLSGTSMATPIVSGAVALLQNVAQVQLGAKIAGTNEIPAGGGTAAERNVWHLLRDTATLVTDSPLANSTYTDTVTGSNAVDAMGNTLRVPTTGATYKRINVLRAAEKILEWRYSDINYGATPAGLEFNQLGEASFNFTPGSSTDVSKLRFSAPGGKTYKVSYSTPALGGSIAPAVILRPSSATAGAFTARASRSGTNFSQTLPADVYDLILRTQLNPGSGYASLVKVSGPKPTENFNHSGNRLRDANDTATAYINSIAANQTPHYHRFVPALPNGTINLASNGAATLQAVVSLYDEKGKLVPNGRAVASTVGGNVSVNFTGLQVGKVYSVRVGSKDYASTGGYKLWKTYSGGAALEAGPEAELASGPLVARQIAGINAVANSLGRFADRFATHGDMTKTLPLLNTSVAQLSAIDSVLQSDFVDPFKAGLASVTSVDELVALLESIEGATLSVEPASVTATDDGAGITRFHFRITGQRETTANATLDGITGNDATKLKDLDGAELPVTVDYDIGLELATANTDLLAPESSATLRFTDLSIGVNVDTALTANVQQGLAEGAIAGGTVRFDAKLDAVVHDAGGTTPSDLFPYQLDNLTLPELLTVTPSGTGISADLPLDVQVGQFQKTDAKLQIADANVFDATQPVATKQNWGDLDLFAGISAAELLTLIRGLREKVSSLASLPAINTPIPFTDGVTLGEVLKLNDLLDAVDGALSDAEGAAEFVTGGDLLQRVSSALDLPFISQNYDPATQSLTFRIDWAKAINQTLPFRMSVDTSVLDFSATANLALTATADFGFTFGIDLSPPGSGVTLAQRFFLDDAKLEADVALNVTNVGGSAELFDFVGVNLTGGSGVASASISVDFYGGDRVTLADIGRSIAQSGAAITGTDPVPAALGNLNYTGSGDITLPNISLTGISFTPQGTPQLKITLPDFKAPSVLGVDTSQLGDLLNFQSLGFDDLLAAIRQFVNNLKNNAVNSVLATEIPGTGRSIKDLVDFIDRLATAVDQLQNGDASSLQQAQAIIDDKLEQALALADNALTTALDIVRDVTTQKPMIQVQLNAASSFTNRSFAFDLDIDDLLNGTGLAGFPAIASSLIDASASGTINYSGAFNLNLGFGAYLDGLSVVPFVKNTSGLELTAFANANNTLQAELAIGPLAIYVQNGTLKLSDTLAGTNPARFAVGLPPTSGTNGRVGLSELGTLFSNLNDRVTLNAAVNVALPMFGPTPATPLAGVSGGNNIFTVQVGSLSSLFAGATPAIYSPDITSVLAGFNFTGGIGSLITSLDVLLGQLHDVVQGQLFGLDLPVISKSLKNSAPSQLIDTIRQRVQQAAVLPSSAATVVRTEIFNALTLAGISGHTVTMTPYKLVGQTPTVQPAVDADTTEIRFAIVAAKTLTSSQAIDFNLGIPGLSLDVKSTDQTSNPTMNLEVNWAINLNFGINTTSGFYIDTSAANEITANAFVSFPGATALGGELGFLRMTAVNDTSSPTTFLGKSFTGTFFGGGFSANLKSPSPTNRLTYEDITTGNVFATHDVFDYSLNARARANLNLTLETTFQNAAAPVLPKLLADFRMDWSFTQSDSAPMPSAPHNTLAFNNVRLDLGTFLQRQVGPVVTRLYNALEPLRPAIDVFNAALPVVNDLGPLRDLVDNAGNNDGKATLRDLAQAFSDIPTPALSFLDAAAQIDSLYSLVNGFTTTEAPTLSLGNYNVNIASGVASLVQNGTVASVDAQIAALGGAVGPRVRDVRAKTSAFAGFGEGKLSFPLFDNPLQAIDLLIGKDVALAQVDFPKLEFGFSLDWSFPIFPLVTVDVSAGMSGFADFGVGYDTRGLRQFRDSGYNDAAKLINGFYLRDKKNIGGTDVDVAEMGIRGSVDLYASLNAVIVKLSVGGGVSGEIYADLHDPNDDGRVNLDELASLFPYKMFDKYGSVKAGLRAKASVGFWPFKKTYTKTLAEVTLIDFNSYDGPAPASLSNGTLTLNTTSGDDTFVLKRMAGSGGTEDILVMGNSATQLYTGVQRIVFNGGDGDDRIRFVVEERDTNGDGVIDERITITRPATLTGGAGNDKLAGGDGNDSIDGGAGDDEIAGELGNDTLLGGDGDDLVEASGGNDSVDAGLGNDDVDGGLGVDTLRGNAGNDTIAGGGDADSIDAGSGDDAITADEPTDALDTVPSGNDTILGGDGDDDIDAGPGADSINAGAGNDTVSAGDGNDTVDGGTGDDQIAGNVGNDSLLGGDGADLILGHSGTSGDAGADDDRILGQVGNDTVRAGAGVDWVEGGLGADSLLGEAGNDTLIGGNATSSNVDNANDSILGGVGDDFLFGGNATVAAGPPVSVTLFGGTGNDFIDASDGDDRVFSQSGNDLVNAGLGNDSVDAGAGNDTVFAQAGIDTVRSGDGNDLVQGFDGNDSLVAGNNDDTVLGGAGLDTIFGDVGNDALFGDGDADLMYGGAGNDELQGGAAFDTIFGGGGFDAIFGTSRSGTTDDASPDLLFGGMGVGNALSIDDGTADADDTIAGQGGADTIAGEAGNDLLSAGAGNDSVDAGVGNDLLLGDAGDDTLLGQDGDDLARGGVGNDSVTLHAGADRAYGDAGNDTLDLGAGNDFASGGDGADSVLGGTEDDTLQGDAGVDRLFGEAGNDRLEAGTGVGDLLDAGIGNDLIYGSSDGADDANPLDATPFGDSILAGDGNDTVVALGGADTIDGGAGDDSVDAGAHGDRVTLGDGYDMLLAGEGNDSVDAGTGGDRVWLEGGNDTALGLAGDDLIDGGAGVDSILGGDGDDEIRAGVGSGDSLFGEAGHDILIGSDDGADSLDGGAGDDQLRGFAGSDILIGGFGADVIEGGAGDDTAEGGAGADIIAGGVDHDSIYGHSASGAGDDNAVDTLFGDNATGNDDAGAGRDRLFGNGGFDVLLGEGNDDFIADFGQADVVLFGAGDGATPNNFVAPSSTPAPTALPAPTLAERGASLPVGTLPAGRWAELAGMAAGGALGVTSGTPSIAIDASNNRYVAWSDTRNGNAEVYVARWNGIAWAQLAGSASLGGVSSTAASSTQPAITIDGSGQPVVAWIDGADVRASRFNGSSWVSLGAVSATAQASSPRIVNTAAGLVVAWVDSTSGSSQVYVRRFNGTSWVEPVAGSASAGGVSNAAGGASQLALASDGTNVAVAWTQSVGFVTQVMLRELVGPAWADRSGSSTGNGASNAPLGASQPSLAYFGGSLFVAFVAPSDTGGLLNGVNARRHDGAAWTNLNVVTPAAGLYGQVFAPALASGGGQLVLGWSEPRTQPGYSRAANFARFDGTSFVGELPIAAAEGFATGADAISIAVDISGTPTVALAELRGVRVIAKNAPLITRTFIAEGATTVQSILDANDLGPGDAIIIRGSVLGFTLVANDAGVLIVSDRANPAIVTSNTSIQAASQVVGVQFNGPLTVQADNVTLREVRATSASPTAFRGQNLSIDSSFFAAATIDQASSGVIAGNTFDADGTAISLNITAAFTGPIRGNLFTGSSIGIHLGAPATLEANEIAGNATGIRIAGVTLATANVIRDNTTGVLLQSNATVRGQAFVGNVTGVSGTGTVGAEGAGNVFRDNGTGASVSGVVQFNTFDRNGVAVVAGANTRVLQNQILTDSGDGIRAAAARVVIAQNSVITSGKGVHVAAGSSEVEVKNNTLVSTAGHALYIDDGATTGLWSDSNLLHASDGAHLVHYYVDFDDILDWQQDVFRHDLRSSGRTLVDPSATRPRFEGIADLRARAALGGVRAASPASDLGDNDADVGVTRSRTNLLANSGFDAGSTTGWSVSSTGSAINTPILPWQGSHYFTTGANANGFAEQTIDLLAAGFSTGQLDSQDLAAIFGARVRIAGATTATISFLNGSSALIGAARSYSGTADSSRWELVGGRERLPSGTRFIKVRFDGAAASTAIDGAFLYVESDALGVDAGAGGGTSTDLGSAIPRIALRSVDLYTDLVLDKPTVIRWDTFGDANERPVRIDLLQDSGGNGAQFVTTLAAAVADTGSFEFRPLDFGLPAGASGYRIRVSLVGDDVAFDRSTEASTIPQAGNQYFVDDASNTNDEYTPGAVGSNRNTGKLASAPKPQLTSVLRIYDLGPGTTVNVDAGDYTQFDRALISGVVGVGDDEGLTIQGPTDVAKVATLNAVSGFTAFDVFDGDAVTITGLRSVGAGRGLYVRNNSINFTGDRLTFVSPAAQGVWLDSTSSGVSLDRISVANAGSYGVQADVFLPSLVNSSIVNSANTGLWLNGGGGTISGNVFQGNLNGIQIDQPVGFTANIGGNRFIGNLRSGVADTSNSTAAINVTGNTLTGHTNATYPTISLSRTNGSISGNVLIGNAYGIYSSLVPVTNNRVEGSTSQGIYAVDTQVIGNVVIGGPVGIRVVSGTNTNVEVARNNLVYGFTSVGLEVNSVHGTQIHNNTIVASGAANAVALLGSTSNVSMRNNILSVVTGTAISVPATAQVGFSSNYNLFEVGAGGSFGTWQAAARTTLALWRTASNGDANSLAGDPNFVDRAGGDFHERSVTGSHKGGSLAPILGVDGLPATAPITLSPDGVHSLAIDRGDASFSAANEPSPNAGLINLGAYGNTSQASLSLATFVGVNSPNGGEQWPVGQTFNITWISHNTAGTVDIVLVKNGVAVLTIASATPNDGAFAWAVPGTLTPDADYRVRVTRNDASGSDESDAPFVIAPATNIYYVNDASSSGDVFTSAVGTALGDGLTAATPNSSIKAILDNYDLGAGDVIRVDTGTYATTVDIVIAADDSGVTIEGPDWTALAAPLATVNRGSPTTNTFVFGGANADNITIRNLGLTGGQNSIRLTANANNNGWLIDRIRSAGNSTLSDHIQINADNAGTTVRNSVFVGSASGGHDGVFVNTANTVVENNTFNDGAIGVEISTGGAATIVRGNTMFSPRTAGVSIGYTSTAPNLASRVQVLDNVITNTVGTANGGDGVNSSGFGIIRGNTISGFTNATGGIAIESSSRLTTIEANTVTGNRIGIYLAGGTASGNTLAGNTSHGIQIFDTIESARTVVSGNRITGSPTGIGAYGGADASHVLNNTIIGATNAINLQSSPSTAATASRVYNNTIVQSAAAGRGIYVNNAASNYRLRNNLFSLSGGTAIEVTSNSAVGFNSDFNLFNLSGTAAIGNWLGTSYPTLAGWQNTVLADADSFTGDPLFANAGAGDYRVLAGSPTIDAGDPDAPFLGEPTLSGGRADIGAFGNTSSAVESAAQVVQVLNPNGGERYTAGVQQVAGVRGFGLAQRDVIFALDVAGETVSQWQPGTLANNLYGDTWFNAATSTNAVSFAGTVDPAPASVYQTYAQTQSTSRLLYNLPASDGAYTLRLHFFEPTVAVAGQRVMDVFVNGDLTLDNFDIIASGASRFQAKIVELPVIASDGGGISLELVDVVSDAIISGIELVRTNAGGAASPSVSTDLSLNNGTTYAPLASGIALDRFGRGSFNWTPVAASSQARLRATSEQFAGASDASDRTFVIENPVNAYYINDGTLDANDLYTSAIGDDANTGLSPASPMRSLPTLLALYDLGPGDVVYIDAGTYNLTSTVSIGIADSGITLQGAGMQLTTLVRGLSTADAITINDADDVTIRNLGVTSGRYGVYAQNNADNILVERVKAFGNNDGGLRADPTNDFVTFRDNVLFGIPGGVSTDNQSVGIYAFGQLNVIEGNSLADHSSAGITSYSDSIAFIGAVIRENTISGGPQGIVIGRGSSAFNNTVSGATNVGISLTFAGTVRGNVLTGNATGISVNGSHESFVDHNDITGGTTGMNIAGGYIEDNTVRNATATGITFGSPRALRGNTVINSPTGLRQTASQGFVATNNLVYGSTVALQIEAGGSNSYDVLRYWNNTLIASVDAIRITAGDQIDIRNNVLVSTGASGYGLSAGATVHNSIASDYNLFNVASGKVARWNGVDYTSLTTWSQRVLLDKHSISADPQFVSPGTGNYAVQATSPTVDAGAPTLPFGYEPGANGGRPNLGHTGNSASAVQSPSRAVHVHSPDGRERFEIGQQVTISYGTSETNLGATTVNDHRAVALGKSPAGYWTMDETSGTALVDLSGNGRNGSYTGAVTLGGSGGWGNSAAPTFAGGTASVPANAALNTGSVSIGGWIKPDAGNTGLAGIMMKLTTSTPANWNGGFGMYYADGAVNFFNVTPVQGLLSAPIPEGQWSHVIATVTQNEGFRLYVNGAMVAYRAYPSASNTSSGAVVFGGGYGTTAFRGQLDEMALFPSVLSQADIANLYASSVSQFASRTVSLDLMREGNPTPVASIGTNLPLNGSVNWTVPADLELDAAYRIRATYADGFDSVADVSNAPILIVGNGTNYYVNDAATAGDVYASAAGDDNVSGKSPDKPMASLQMLLDAYDLDAGDTVWVDAGTYALPINVKMRTEDSGVHIVGAGRAATTFNRGMSSSAGDMVGFEFLGAQSVRLAQLGVTGAFHGIVSWSGIATSGLTIEDVAAFGNSSSGVIVSSGTNTTVRRVLAYGLPGGAPLDNQAVGISITGSGTLVDDSETYDNANSGIAVDGSGNVVSNSESYRNANGIQITGPGATSTAAGNTVYNNTSRGIVAGSTVVVTGNRVFGQTTANSVGIASSDTVGPVVRNNEVFGNLVGIQTNAEASGNRVYNNSSVGITVASAARVIGNTVYSNSTGISVTSANPGNEVSNNLLYGNTNFGLTLTNLGTTGDAITGNTIYQDVGDAIRLSGTATNARLHGNLLWVNSGFAITVDAGSQSGFLSDNNLFHRTAAGQVGQWGGVARPSLVDWQTTTSRDASSVAGDPLFVDIDGADNLLGYVGGVDRGRDDNFYLRAGSPAIDRGNGVRQLSVDFAGDTRRDDPATVNAGTGYAVGTIAPTTFPAGGTPLNAGIRADNAAVSVNLAFSFPFFGTSYNIITVTSNGTLHPGTTFTSSEANSLALIRSVPTIAALFDAIRTDQAGDNVWSDATVANQITFRWNATNKADNSDVQFAVTLYSTGQIDMLYGPGNVNLTPTVGIAAGNNRESFVLSPYDGLATLTNAAPVRFSIGASTTDIGAFEFGGSSSDAARPTVLSTVPSGIHASGSIGTGTSSIAVNLSEAVNPLDARSTTIYELRGAGTDNTFGTGDDVVYALAPSYVSQSTQITLGITSGALPVGLYRFTIKGTPSGNSGLHDLAGNVLDGTGSGGADYTRTFSVVADNVPPTVSGVWNWDVSSPNVQLDFSEDIGSSLTPSDLLLENLSTGQTIATAQLSVSYDSITRRAVITYTGSVTGRLPDGRYRLTLAAGSVSDAAGNGLAAPFVLNFLTKVGDATNDGIVNFDDLLRLAANYNQSGRTVSQGDFSYDGIVNFDDLLILAAAYNSSLPASPAGSLTAGGGDDGNEDDNAGRVGAGVLA